LEGLAVRTIFNPHYAMGMSASLIAGLQTVAPQAEGAMIFLGDQPLVSTEVIRTMLKIFRKNPKPILVPAYDDLKGNPVLFSRSLFPELMTVEGDKGGREVVLREPGRVTYVAFSSDLAPRDVDTWEDYEVLQASVSRTGG
jgi:molybdenum cofactor cytidylyltransferase